MAQAEAFELGTQLFLYKSWQTGHKEGHNSYICSSSLLQATELSFIFLYCRAQKYSTTPEKPRMPHSMRSGSLEIAASEHLGQGTWLCFPLPQHERGGESWKQGWAEIEEREQISGCMCLTDAAGIRGRRELQKGLSTRKHGMLHKQEPKPTGKVCPQPTLLSRHRSCHEGIAYQLF